MKRTEKVTRWVVFSPKLGYLASLQARAFVDDIKKARRFKTRNAAIVVKMTLKGATIHAVEVFVLVDGEAKVDAS